MTNDSVAPREWTLECDSNFDDNPPMVTSGPNISFEEMEVKVIELKAFELLHKQKEFLLKKVGSYKEQINESLDETSNTYRLTPNLKTIRELSKFRGAFESLQSKLADLELKLSYSYASKDTLAEQAAEIERDRPYIKRLENMHGELLKENKDFRYEVDSLTSQVSILREGLETALVALTLPQDDFNTSDDSGPEFVQHAITKAREALAKADKIKGK